MESPGLDAEAAVSVSLRGGCSSPPVRRCSVRCPASSSLAGERGARGNERSSFILEGVGVQNVGGRHRR